MVHEVQGVISRSEGRPGRADHHPGAGPGAGRGSGATSRPAGCATRICTTSTAASATTTPTCSATRRPASSRRSARASPTWHPVTTSS